MFTIDPDETKLRKRLVDLIVGEDDPDIRDRLATLLAFQEVEVDEEAPYQVGIDTERLLDGLLDVSDGTLSKEDIGTGIWRYSF